MDPIEIRNAEMNASPINFHESDGLKSVRVRLIFGPKLQHHRAFSYGSSSGESDETLRKKLGAYIYLCFCHNDFDYMPTDREIDAVINPITDSDLMAAMERA